MTIEQAQIIDGMGIDRASGVAVLFISDHLRWGTPKVELLEDKISAYVQFIESNQLVEKLPGAEGRTVEIRLICQHPPGMIDVVVLETVKKALSARGIGFAHELLPEGY